MKLESRHWLLPLLAVALAALLWSLLRSDAASLAAATDEARPPRYLADKAVISRFNDAGALTVHGTAEHVEYFDDESARAQILDATFYSPRQREWSATAPSAWLPAKGKRLLLEGEVNAQGRWPDTNQPVALQTWRLWVDPDAHSLSTDDKVYVRSEGRDGSGTGLRADWVAKRLTLLHDVRMRYDQRR